MRAACVPLRLLHARAFCLNVVVSSVCLLCMRTQVSDQERRMVKKYKMVKFFERRKVERELAKLAKAGEDTSETQRKLNYIAYYPKTEAYIAMFAEGGDGEGAAATVNVERRTEIMDEIARRVSEGELEHVRRYKLRQEGL